MKRAGKSIPRRSQIDVDQNIMTAVEASSGGGATSSATSDPTKGYVPYSDADNDVDLGAQAIDAADFNGVVITKPGTSATLTLADDSELETQGSFAVTLVTSAASTVAMPASTSAIMNYCTANPSIYSIPYAGAANGLLSYLAPNTTTATRVLKSIGTGSAGQAPVFAAFSLAEISDITTVGQNLGKISTPAGYRFIRVTSAGLVETLTDSELRTAIGAGTSSFDGAYASLSGKPTLGTASAQDVGYFATAAQAFPGFGTTHALAAYGDHAHAGVYQPVIGYTPAQATAGPANAHAALAVGPDVLTGLSYSTGSSNYATNYGCGLAYDRAPYASTGCEGSFRFESPCAGSDFYLDKLVTYTNPATQVWTGPQKILTDLNTLTPLTASRVALTNASKDLVSSIITSTELEAIASGRDAILASNPNNPTPTSSTTEKMMGINEVVTPLYSTRLMVVITGVAANTTAAQGYSIKGRYGTGAAPANGASATGTQFGVTTIKDTVAAGVEYDFCIHCPIVALTPNTAYWFDLGLNARGSGAASVKKLSVSIVAI